MARAKMKDKYKKGLQRIIMLIFAVAVLVYLVPIAKKQLAGNADAGSSGINQDYDSNHKKDSASSQSTKKPGNSSPRKAGPSNVSSEDISSEDTELTIWLDSWVWLPIAAANGGNETTPDSEFGKRGLTVHIINNESDDEKAEAFKNGEIDAMAATVNRLSLLSGEFYGNTEYVVPYLMDYSSGGDGIVARSQYDSIESLKDAKVAVGNNSVSHAMLIYFYDVSNLSDEELSVALSNIVTYPSSEEAAQAYMRGEVDAVATWQPFLSQCAQMEDSKLLFSTATSSKLIMDALIMNKDFVQENPKTVELFIDGMLEVVENLKNGGNKNEYYATFRNTFPEFAESSDAELDEMFFEDAQLMDWHENIESFQSGVVTNMFTDMCNVWNIIGSETVPSVAKDVFDDSFLVKLTSKYQNTGTKAKKVLNIDESKLGEYDALITKSFTVTFKPYSAEFMDEAEAIKQIEEFVKVAQVLDGAIIRVEGNVSSRTDSEELKVLSLMRAEAIRDLMVEYGLDVRVIFCYGNGASKQKYADPQTSREYELNRSVDGMFVTDEEIFGDAA